MLALLYTDSLEISKLRNTDHHPCDAKIDNFDTVLVRDILRNVSCRPHYIQDEFTDLPNCTNVDDVKKINSNLDLENTFSKFKSFHTKPCANFALTHQQKYKVLSLYKMFNIIMLVLLLEREGIKGKKCDGGW